MKIVEVTWKDTMMHEGWRDPTEIEARMGLPEGTFTHKSSGYLFKTTKEEVSVFSSYNARDGLDGSISYVQRFPREIVMEVREVKTGRKVKLP